MLQTLKTITIGLTALSAAGAVTWLAGGLILSLLGDDDYGDDPGYPFVRMAVGLLGLAIPSGVLAVAYLIGKAVTG